MNQTVASNSQNRIAKWDNLKFILIACVVIGHCLYEFYGKIPLAKTIYLFIYTFHMPVFVFVSGLFSKNTIKKARYEVVIQYLVIYIFMQFLDDFAKVILKIRAHKPITGVKLGFHLFYSDGPEWYALAMAVFIFVTIFIRNSNRTCTFIAAVILGCLAGLDSHLGIHFASMRICTFYPVFLAGYYIDPSVLEFDNEKNEYSKSLKYGVRVCCATFMACLFALCWYKEKFLFTFINFFKAKVSYVGLKFRPSSIGLDGSISEALGFSGSAPVSLGITGVFLRFFCYLLWAILIFCLISLCTEKEHFWTWLGRRTQATFVWHKFILTLVLGFGAKAYIKHEIPHHIVLAAICLAMIIAILSAYLFDFSIANGFGIDLFSIGDSKDKEVSDNHGTSSVQEVNEHTVRHIHQGFNKPEGLNKTISLMNDKTLQNEYKNDYPKNKYQGEKKK